jgi:hypothetical protein
MTPDTPATGDKSEPRVREKDGKWPENVAAILALRSVQTPMSGSSDLTAARQRIAELEAVNARILLVNLSQAEEIVSLRAQLEIAVSALDNLARHGEEQDAFVAITHLSHIKELAADTAKESGR